MTFEDRQQPDGFIVVSHGPDPIRLDLEPVTDADEDPGFDPYTLPADAD